MASKLIRVLAAALLVAAAVSVDARLVVRMVQVVHRHGARSALINDNTTEICGTLYPCGELTGEGVEMVRAIGESPHLHPFAVTQDWSSLPPLT
ncbi:tartrate-sensitive acid phosphatase acp-3.2, putative [Leishmania donovani]|uniref:Tartrate-sensitive acid phosphatase acp-3.2, putative n=1 Tax=Leishmania donovani TaxID=5661 RepID=E9BV30_LEIDO|nr:tartrate-sensitive acid phosphatase acp-3.2, putative [Leishmania donovani]CBZ39109.1 tartrate-sensitive acid phosphatase acp-3.2, putative [Leishmania donovani]